MFSSPSKGLLVIAILTITLVIVQLLTPHGISVWMLYLIPLGLTVWLPPRHATLVAAAAYSLLVLTGLLLATRDLSDSTAVLNHALGLCTFWAMAWLLHYDRTAHDSQLRAESSKRREVEEQLRFSREALIEEQRNKLDGERQKVQRFQERQGPQRGQETEMSRRICEAVLTEMNGLLLEQGLRTAVAAANAEAGAILLHDRTSRKLVFKSAIGEKAEMLTERELPPGGSIAEAVFASGRAEIIPDARLDSRHNPTLDSRTGFRTGSMLVLPLKLLGQDPIGVMELLNKRTGLFTLGDLQVLRAYATLLTAMIQHARLYQQQLAQSPDGPRVIPSV